MIASVDASTLRNHLSDALKEVLSKKDYMLITKNSKPVSALVNLDFFEDLLALNSKEFKASIRQAREQARKGRLLSHAEVFGKL